MQRRSVPAAVASVHSAEHVGGSPFFPALFHIYWLMKMTGGIWFIVVVLIRIPPAITRDAEHLVLCWLEYFSFLFFFFFLLGMCGNFTFRLESCKLGVFATFFSNIYPRTFLEASCHWQQPPPPRPPRVPLWIGDASKRLWSSCSCTKWPQGGSTFDDHSGSWGKRSIKESRLGLWKWNVSERTFKGLYLTTYSH